MQNLPDSTWTFVDRQQVLIKKGRNNEPRVKDFLFRNADGIDVTHDVLLQEGTYYLLLLNNPAGLRNDAAWIKELERIAATNRVYIITSMVDATKAFFADNVRLQALPIFSCDGTAIKTAARAVPVLYRMQGAVVAGKWAAPHFYKVQ